jgi:glycosyltransferase involved in cell wall biosynthesis
MKLLLICHGLAPGRGSEPGLAWNWAWSLSKDHQVWTLAHPEYREEVDAYLAAHPNPQLRIIWLHGTAWDPARGQRGFRWHYLRWLREAERAAADLHARTSFDLVHLISLGTVSVAPSFWKLGIPFVWGPLGGAQTCPPQLRALFGNERWREWVRVWRLRAFRYYPPFRAAVKHSAVVLATNRETLSYLEEAGTSNVHLLPDSGVPDEDLSEPPQRRDQRGSVRILWAGGFDKRKALPLAFEALAVGRGDVPLTLAVAGDGVERERWTAAARTLGVLDRVQFLGKLSPLQMREEFRQSDIFLFTSVRESFGSVVLEAMTSGLPVVSLDLHGIGACVPDSAALKVPATGSRAAVVDGIADALDRLARDPELRFAIGRAGWNFAATQRWHRRSAFMNGLYREATARRVGVFGENRVYSDGIGR